MNFFALFVDISWNS